MPGVKRFFLSAIPALIAGSNQVTAKKPGVLPGKLFLYFVVCTMCCSCFPARDLQGELVYATLVKVEEVTHYPNVKTKVLTWETTKFVSFKTFESSFADIPIGTKTRVVVVR